MLELTGFLGLTRISFFLLTQIPQIPLYCFVGGKSHRCFCVWVARADSTLLLGSHGSHFLGSHGSHRSHSIALWVGNLTDDSACGLCSRGFRLVFGLTRISQIPRYCFVGGKSHRCFCVWAVSRGFHFAFWLTRISDPTVLLCGWEISQMALWVWAPGGCTGLALTDLSFGPFGQIRPIGQIGRIGHF